MCLCESEPKWQLCITVSIVWWCNNSIFWWILALCTALTHQFLYCLYYCLTVSTVLSVKRCIDTHFVVNFFLFLSYLSFIPLVHVQQLESVLCLMMWTRSMVSMDTVLTLNCTVQRESSCLTAFPSCFAGEVNCALYNKKKRDLSPIWW